MAQSAGQTFVTSVITAQQLKLLVDKVEKKDRGIELFNLIIAGPNWAEVRYTVERKVRFSEWLRVRARLLGLPIDIVPADEELSELAGELKAVKKISLAVVLPQHWRSGNKRRYTPRQWSEKSQ